MTKPPAFQFYADDFLAGTVDMSQEEVGAYIRLLCHQWNRGGLPNDVDRLAMLVRTNNEPKNEAALRYVLAEKFVLCDDGQLRNLRMEMVRKQSEEWKQKSVSGGKASAVKRLGNSDWGKRMAEQRTKQRTNNEARNEPSHEPTTNTPTPSPTPINTHTHTQGEPDWSNLPDWMRPAWGRWQRLWFSWHGRWMDPIQADAIAMEVGRRGPEKGLADLEFTILHNGKSLLDSSNDFQKRAVKPTRKGANAII